MDGHGFTGFHLRGGAGWFDGEDPDVGFYRAVEALLRRVHERGGASHLWMWGAGRDEDDEGPIALAGGPMSPVDQRNLRYLAARLGPIPGWSMGYGFDTENAWAPREELDAWKAFLEARMAYDHFLGARVSADDKGLWAIEPRPPKPPLDAANNAPIGDAYTSWLGGDYVGYTSYRPLYPRYVQAIYHHPERPSFEEDRFRLRDRENWAYKDYSEELTRRGLWHAAMAGGVANIWGNLLPEADEGGSQPYAIKDQIKTYARFFEGRFLKEMQTVYEGPELRLSTPEGTHAIVYREDADVVRLDLSGMKGEPPRRRRGREEAVRGDRPRHARAGAAHVGGALPLRLGHRRGRLRVMRVHAYPVCLFFMIGLLPALLPGDAWAQGPPHAQTSAPPVAELAAEVEGTTLRVSGLLPRGVPVYEIRIASDRNTDVSRYTDVSPDDKQYASRKEKFDDLVADFWYPVVDVRLEPGMEAVASSPTAPTARTSSAAPSSPTGSRSPRAWSSRRAGWSTGRIRC